MPTSYTLCDNIFNVSFTSQGSPLRVPLSGSFVVTILNPLGDAILFDVLNLKLDADLYVKNSQTPFGSIHSSELIPRNVRVSSIN